MPFWIIASYFILAAVCIFSAASLFARGNKGYCKQALSTFIFYTVVFLAVWIFRISVPHYVLFLAMLPVLGACFLGYYLGLYDKSHIFDRYLHSLGALSSALLGYAILDDFVAVGGSALFRAIFIFTLGNTVGVIFELTEMCHDLKKNVTKSQRGLRDTDMDLLFGLIGSVLAGILGYFLL